MIYDHISIGGGVIGINTTINLLKKFLKCKLTKKIKLCVVDKNLSNIPGGIAYGKKTSIHGYFNNPLRLSHLELQKYYSKIKNFKKIENYLNTFGSNYDLKKFNENFNILKKKDKKKINELYLPRVAFSFLQESSFINILNKVKKLKKNIQLDFYEGEVISFKKNKLNYFKIFPMKKFSNFTLKIKKSKSEIFFQPNNKVTKNLSCKNITIGLGVTPPKKLIKNQINNKYYIWDFYAEGGTSYLINKINSKLKLKKVTKLCFIGSKAGFLESLQEIYRLKKNNNSLKIYCFSKKFETLQPAKISFNKKINLKFLNKRNKSIQSAEELFNVIEKELDSGQKNNNNNKYLIWTKILSSNILDYFLKRLSEKELVIYQKKYFHKIRNLTRFTFPETIKVKDIMIKKKMIKIIKEKVHKIKLSKDLISLYGDKKKYTFDIVVNVTGPGNLVETSKYLNIYKSLLKFTKKEQNIIVDKNFSLTGNKNLFSPGTITRGFNDQRQTIIKAIIRNSDISSLQIYKRILGQNS